MAYDLDMLIDAVAKARAEARHRAEIAHEANQNHNNAQDNLEIAKAALHKEIGRKLDAIDPNDPNESR